MPSTQGFGLQCLLLSKLQHQLQFPSTLSGKPCREVFGTNTAFADFVEVRKHSTSKKPRRWVARVKTDSTHPPTGLFNKDAAAIARSLASKKVSPKGPGSGMRMLTYYINRAGHNLPATRRRELERAKRLLSQRIHGRTAQR